MANVTQTYTLSQTGEEDLSITISIPEEDVTKYSDYQWDSKTG